MRRFIYEDNEHEVRVLVDIPEELFTQVKSHSKRKLDDAIKDIARYTIDKERPNEFTTE